MTPENEQSVFSALLRLASEKLLREITWEALADESGVSEGALREKFGGVPNLFPAFVSHIDDRVESRVDTANLASNPHARLFDILMLRFDFLQENRPGVIALARACRANPDLAARVTRAHWRSMGQALSLARIEREGPAFFLQKTGLLAVFHCAVRRWETDESPDMSTTMGTLDRALRHYAHLFWPEDSLSGLRTVA